MTAVLGYRFYYYEELAVSSLMVAETIANRPYLLHPSVEDG